MSVAVIEPLKDLVIADLSKLAAIGDSSYKSLISLLTQDLITQGGWSPRDYFFPQYKAECCKYNGYDGIAYKSKYCSVSSSDGKNAAIFNYDKCRATGSKLYRITQVDYKYAL